MALADTNEILRAYLVTQVALTNLIGGATPRLYCLRLPENAQLPAIGFFTRGGRATPYIPDIPSPSVQFDCWAADPITARQVYRALYDALQGTQNKSVVVGGKTYLIMGAREEVQGQDLADQDIQNYYRVLSFWELMMMAETP